MLFNATFLQSSLLMLDSQVPCSAASPACLPACLGEQEQAQVSLQGEIGSGAASYMV